MEQLKTKEQLEQLPTKRLLAYYKSVRGRKIGFIHGHTCECCGTPSWELYPNDDLEKTAKGEIEARENYMKLIKSVLDSREHVKTK